MVPAASACQLSTRHTNAKLDPASLAIAPRTPRIAVWAMRPATGDVTTVVSSAGFMVLAALGGLLLLLLALSPLLLALSPLLLALSPLLLALATLSELSELSLLRAPR